MSSSLEQRQAERARKGSRRKRDQAALDRAESTERRERDERIRAALEGEEAARETWEAALETLAEKVPEGTRDLWFAPLRALGGHEGMLVLEGPGHVTRWVRRRYPELLRRVLEGSGYKGVTFVLAAEEPAEAPEVRW